MIKKKCSDEIVLRFPMTKGEGELPVRAELSEDEINNPKSICTFNLDLDYGAFEEDLDPIGLKEITIIYDGVTQYSDTDINGKEEMHGIYWDNDINTFDGYPTPIVKFKFEKPIEKEKFLRLVMSSCVNVRSKVQQDSDGGGFYFEDYNGWVEELEGDKLKNWVRFLEDALLYSGRVFKFNPDNPIFPLAEQLST